MRKYREGTSSFYIPELLNKKSRREKTSEIPLIKKEINRDKSEISTMKISEILLLGNLTNACPDGEFQLTGMKECRPYLTCEDFNDIK